MIRPDPHPHPTTVDVYFALGELVPTTQINIVDTEVTPPPYSFIVGPRIIPPPSRKKLRVPDHSPQPEKEGPPSAQQLRDFQLAEFHPTSPPSNACLSSHAPSQKKKKSHKTS